MITRFAIVILLGAIAPISADSQFVVPKKKKAPSTSTLREDCCRSLAHITTDVFPAVQHAMADALKDSLICVGDFLESSKKAVISQLSRDELEELNDALNRVEHQLLAAREGLISLQKIIHKNK